MPRFTVNQMTIAPGSTPRFTVNPLGDDLVSTPCFTVNQIDGHPDLIPGISRKAIPVEIDLLESGRVGFGKASVRLRPEDSPGARTGAGWRPGQEGQCDSRTGNFLRARLPVVSGNSYLGLAGYVIHSQRLHTRSVSPAAIAGVRDRQCPSPPGTRNVRTHQQKL